MLIFRGILKRLEREDWRRGSVHGSRFLLGWPDQETERSDWNLSKSNLQRLLTATHTQKTPPAGTSVHSVKAVGAVRLKESVMDSDI